MIEEDVDELPEHVVQRLDELLADRRVGAGRGEGPAAALTFRDAGAEADRHAAASRGNCQRPSGLLRTRSGGVEAEADDDVVRACMGLELTIDGTAFGGQRQGRQRPLADDHRVHELD